MGRRMEKMKPEEVRLLQEKSLPELMRLLGERKREYLAGAYSAEFLRYYDLMVLRREEKLARRRADKAANVDRQLKMFK